MLWFSWMIIAGIAIPVVMFLLSHHNPKLGYKESSPKNNQCSSKGCPFKTHVNIQACEILFIHNNLSSCQIIFKLQTEDSAMLCAKFHNDSTEQWVMCKQVLMWFELGTLHTVLQGLYTWHICSCTINSITWFMSYGKIVFVICDYGKWVFLWFEFKIGPIVMTFITCSFTGSICVIYISYTMKSLSVRFAAAIPQLPVQ